MLNSKEFKTGFLALVIGAALGAGALAFTGCAAGPEESTAVGEIGADDGHGYRCFPCDPTVVNDLILNEAEAFANQIMGYAVGVSATCIDLGEGGSECLVWFATNDEGCPTLKVDCTSATGGSNIRCSSLGCGGDW